MFARPEYKPVLTDVGTEMLTKQSFREECDINTIMKQYRATGIIGHVAQRDPVFLDIPDIPDYQAALNQVRAAEAAFEGLPSAIRERYENDPGRLLDALGNEGERVFLQEHGILQAPLQEAASQAAEGGGE